jgi:hypothetical protein
METRAIKQVPSNGLSIGSTKGVWVPTAAIFCFSTTSFRHAMTSNQPFLEWVLALLSEKSFQTVKQITHSNNMTDMGVHPPRLYAVGTQ